MAEHILIGDVAPRVHYVGDGTRTDFAFPFPIFDAADIELRIGTVVVSGGYAVVGARSSNGGTVSLAEPPAAGASVTLRRRLKVERSSDFQDHGPLRARSLNDELDRLVAILQEQREEIDGTLRQGPGDVGGQMVLPPRPARANRLLGFDSNGNAVVFPRDSSLLTAPFPGSVPRTAEDKMGEHLSARDFGAIGDGATDDGPALQAAMNAAAAAGKTLLIGEGSFRTTLPLTLRGAAAGLVMRGTLFYAGPAGQPALTIGDGGTARNIEKTFIGLAVQRATQSDWSNEGDIGILLRNLEGSVAEIRSATGFTIGIRTLGDARGFENSTLVLGRILNNRIGLDIRTTTLQSWNCAMRYLGGQFAVVNTLHVDKDRFGVRLSTAPGGSVLHNRHVFDGPNFQLSAIHRPIAGIPFLSEVNSRAVIARAMHMEGCSPIVARHTAGAQDHLYEVAWATQGYQVEIEHTATATRLGGLVRTLHQAGPHVEATRVVAAVPSLRAAAIRWSATETGFEALAMLSSSVAGNPTALGQLCFPALDGVTLNARGAVLGAGRAVGFVVDARRCKDFVLAVDADQPRLMVMCFDATMGLLTDAAGRMVMASNQALQWNSTARWWQGAFDMEDATSTRLQAVRLAPAVSYAVIGLTRVAADYELRAMRLFCEARHAPAVLFGLPDLRHGVRDLAADMPWDPPAIAAGTSAQVNVTVPGARPGDFVQAAFSLPSPGVVFLAQIAAPDTVAVTAWNRNSTTVDLGAGTVRARVTKA